MTHLEFFNTKVSPSMADISLAIDEQVTDLYSTLHYWLVEDEEQATIEECETAMALEPGESFYIGIVEIRRI